MRPRLQNRTALGALFTVLAMLGFASMDAISKWLVAGYPIGQMMWIRYAVFCVFAWIVVRPHGGFVAALRSARPLLQIARALLAVVESATFVLAFRYLPLADTHAIAATSPLIVVALGAAFLGERVDRARWLAVFAGFVGVLLIVRPGFRVLDWPLLIPIAGAILWGSYQILVRLCARTDPPQTTLVWSAFAAFIATSFVGPWDWHWPDAASWALLAAMAVLGSLSHYALIRALDYAEASAVQPYSYTLLVWVTVLGALVFGDFPDGWTLLGAAVIVASGLYTWHHDRRQVRQAASAAKP
ncbi:Permease of the drug/metabolite transporter (DMT) superfamily [Enhydrobacter aerosaccus]|uniref:Permease of the drug/metabolite transporter (DMT) superfamily n=1 Tax=Enhydrobacter aerosaccus TaxID=225324 RepID=A0A1T4NF60_9HYPH|nr:DMT family transporter [Enhydrobacter aerosaccus]SJZ77902.1 Permease of the drug/metabolite transporter (DMT) superfamily [Enhydrobacter aerosaccus]